MKQNPKQNQCTVNERNGQLVFALNNEILLPVNTPARLTSAQLEELDYRKLYRAYSARGRKSKVDPRVLFKVMAYGYQCGIYSSRKLEEACRYRVDFMWLLEEEPGRIIQRWHGFGQGGVQRQWRICFTSMWLFWNGREKRIMKRFSWMDRHGGEEEARLGQVLPNLEPTGPM